MDSGHESDSDRSAKRYKLNLNLMDCLKTILEGSPVGCISRDVSRYGLGIVTFKQISQRKRYILDFPAQKKLVLLDLRWCRQDENKEGIYHAGFQMKNTRKDLTQLFLNEGLISGQYLFPSADREPPLTRAEYRAITSRLHVDDPELLRTSELRHLYTSHTAYLCRHRERPVIVAINRHLNPANLSNLSLADAASCVFIFRQSGDSRNQQWIQVWPDRQVPKDLLSVSGSLGWDQNSDDDVDHEIVLNKTDR